MVPYPRQQQQQQQQQQHGYAWFAYAQAPSAHHQLQQGLSAAQTAFPEPGTKFYHVLGQQRTARETKCARLKHFKAGCCYIKASFEQSAHTW
jgi:hypothetical protein